MKKRALLKMIDTYISQLVEIRKDINNMVADDTFYEPEKKLDKKETTTKILELLEDFESSDIKSILEKVEEKLIILDKIKKRPVAPITLDTMEKALLDTDLTISKSVDNNTGYKTTFLNAESKYARVSFTFGSNDTLRNVRVTSK